MERTDILRKFATGGIQSTPQRIEIAEIIFKKKQHLSAEQLLERLRAKNSAVSKATVYNTLNLFAERGLVRECIVDPERRFYDSNTEAHHHFFVMDTGELVDIPDGEIRFADLPAFPAGGQIEGVEVLIKIRRNDGEKPG
jgi:Fur family iron response transcriptional regulator